MASVEQLAKKMLADKQDPFAQLDRDMPKGNVQSEQTLENTLGGVAKKGARGALTKGVLADTAVGMLVPEDIGDEQGQDELNRGFEKAEALKVDPATLPLKGHPDMIEKGSETVYMDPKDNALLQNFEKYGKKQLGDGFSVQDVGVEDETGDTPERYSLKMQAEGAPLTEQERMKVAGIHAMLRKERGVKKGAKNEINLPKSKSNTVILEGDE